MSGIFGASLFWVGVNWLFTLFPATVLRAGKQSHVPSSLADRADNTADSADSHILLNVLFAVFLGLTAYFYILCMVEDPGFVPKLNGIAEQKAVIDELIGLWKFDEANFCVTCMIRTPLRSKHCRRCNRCVARQDQFVSLSRLALFVHLAELSASSHCPWVYNCIGINNHRHFFLYLINLTLGVITYDWLSYYCKLTPLLSHLSSV